MANDTRRIKVVVTSDSDEAVKGLHDVETASDKAGNKVQQLGTTMQKLGREFDAATAKAHGVTKSFANLGIDKQKAQIERLEKSLANRKNFVNLVESGTRIGAELATNITSGVGKTISSTAGSNPYVAAGFAALAVAGTALLLPVISSGITTAVLGGAAGGGIIGGIKLASKNPQVQAATKDLKDHIGKQLELAAQPFVPELLRQIPKVRSIFDSVSNDIQGIFAQSAKYLDPLVKGAGGFVREVVPAIKRAVIAAEPIFQALGEELPKIGQAVADAFDEISKNGADMGTFVKFISGGLQDIIRFTGGIISVTASWFRSLINVANVTSELNRLFEWVPGIGDELKENRLRFDELKKSLDGTGQSATEAGISTSLFGQKTQTAGEKAKAARDKVMSLFDSLLDLKNQALAASNSAIGLEQAIDDATASFKTNKATLDINTAAGRANRSALNQLAAATNTLASDVLKQTGSQEKASAAAARGRDQFIKLADKMGLTRGEAAKLASQLIAIPDANVKVTASGIGDVQSRLLNLSKFQQALKRGTEIPLQYRGNGGKLAFAQGGPVSGPGTSTSDSIAARLSRGEFVVKADAVRKYGVQFFSQLNAMKFAKGGVVDWPFPTTASMTRVPSLDEVRKAVVPNVSGNWRSMQAAITAAFGKGLRMISGFRPGARTLSGNRSYHALGRAVDYPAVKTLAAWINRNFGRRTKELITPWQQFNLHNGRPHRYTGAVWNQHNFAGGNAHVHWAMDSASVVQPGWFMGYNGTGKPETLANPERVDMGGDTFVFNVYNQGVGNMTEQDAKKIRAEFIRLSKRNGGRAGLPG